MTYRKHGTKNLQKKYENIIMNKKIRRNKMNLEETGRNRIFCWKKLEDTGINRKKKLSRNRNKLKEKREQIWKRQEEK